jgi:transcriptional regulator with XRE-family HTH domain
MMTPLQCKLGRTALGWTVRQLAQKAKVSANTVSRFESGKTEAQPSTVTVMQQALELEGIEFTNGDAPGIRVRRAR